MTFPRALAPLARERTFRSFLRSLFRQNWFVYAKPPFGGPRHVLHYLARYTHRVAISNHRMVPFTDGQVTFRWKDYAHGSKQKLMTVTAEEFLRRFLLMYFRLASSASASSGSWPAVGERSCCHSRDNCCTWLLPTRRIRSNRILALQRYVPVHFVAARCFFSTDSRLRKSARNRRSRRFTLTALNNSRVPAKSTNLSTATLHVCSVCALGNHLALSAHIFTACTVHPMLKFFLH